jgi:hypothetical protein
VAPNAYGYSRITSNLRKSHDTDQWKEEAVLSSLPQQTMSLEDKLANWNTADDPADIEPEHDPEDVTIAPQYQEVRTFLLDSAAFRWLLQRAQSAAILTDLRGTTLEAITQTMNAAFANTRQRKARSDQVYRVTFDLDWDLPRFLRRQQYDTLHDKMERAITITGNINEAQATTCDRYIDQVWPSTGHELLRALQAAALSEFPYLNSFSRRLLIFFAHIAC